MIQISAEYIQNNTQFETLVDALRLGFQGSIETPMRHHHDFKNPSATQDSTLLLMPSWQAGETIGVKVVTVSPDNGVLYLPSIHGVYLLFNAANGQPKAMLDGSSMTAKRTAGASALASSYLSREASTSLLMIGTGALVPNLIEAHCSQRPIKTVFIWGRSLAKAEQLIDSLSHLKVSLIAIDKIDEYVPKVDIISCATLSPTALIKGNLLRPGQHVDLVGSYKKDTREADNDVMSKASVFVDTYQGGLKESGDIFIPIKQGIINEKDILADLYSLCKNEHSGRKNDKEITVFKSVGHASEDLVAANYYYNSITNE
ncbi:MAG: ornithine cyclodeaminase family protein [Crocinitomicaceae bacterium]|nr:ornithine cyclodeaminase family protein [Crocinitomicaceae bacterium]